MLCATTRRDRSPVSAGRVFTAMESPALQVCDIVRNAIFGASVPLTKGLGQRIIELISQSTFIEKATKSDWHNRKKKKN